MERQETAKTSSLSPDDVVTGVVEQIMPYGAFVKLEGGHKAMVHISQLSHRYIKRVEDCIQQGQEIQAKIIKIDDRGRIDLSMKALEEPPAPQPRRPFPPKESAPRGNSSSSACGEGDDFERKLSLFLKNSEDKISTLLSKTSKTTRAPRRKGARS